MYRGILEVTPEEFKKFQKLIKNKVGINFPDTKKRLLESRLSSHITKLGLKSFNEYYNYLQTSTEEEYEFFVDKITTHTTHFFRENFHFDFLIQKGIKIINSQFKNKEIKVLSLGASTGEELYSLSLLFQEQKRNGIINRYQIHGADISKKALLKAKEGTFNIEQLNNIPKRYHPYFKINDNKIIVKEILKSNLKFFLLNASNEFQKFPDKYHIIFCRNTFIYFTKPLQQNIINNIISILHNGGLLFTGQSESLYSLEHSLKKIGSAVYQK